MYIYIKRNTFIAAIYLKSIIFRNIKEKPLKETGGGYKRERDLASLFLSRITLNDFMSLGC